jgi:hypothetical protein
LMSGHARQSKEGYKPHTEAAWYNTAAPAANKQSIT